MITLDIIPVLGHIRRGRYVAPHVHLNASYILIGDEREQIRILPEENSAVRWIPIAEVPSSIREAHMVPLYSKTIKRLQRWAKG